MARSKTTKRGNSLYVEKLYPYSKKFINVCAVCGTQGYNPSIEEEGFLHPSPSVTDYKHRAIWAELTTILNPLTLDELGRCSQCAKVMDKQD